MRKTALVTLLAFLLATLGGLNFAAYAEEPALGPQVTPFVIAASGTTTLPSDRFTYAFGTEWNYTAYSGKYVLTEGGLDGMYVCYDLDVAEAGTYHLTADVTLPGTTDSGMEVLRTGTNGTAPAYDPECGDVIITKGKIAATGVFGTVASNDLGVVNLHAGINRVSFRNEKKFATPYYVVDYKVERVGNYGDVPIKISVRDWKTAVKAADGQQPDIYSSFTSWPYITPFIAFNGGDYQTYDVALTQSGKYCFTAYCTGGNILTIKDAAGTPNEKVLFSAVGISPTEGAYVPSPNKLGEVYLEAGTHEFTISSTGSGHYSFYTLEKVGESGTAGVTVGSIGKTKIGAQDFTGSNRGAGLDWGYPGDYREYTINVESPGSYSFIVNFASASDSDFMVTENDEFLLSEIAVGTGGWGNPSDHLLGTFDLSAGTHVIKLQSSQVMNFHYFTLEKKAALNFEAETCANLATDSLVNFDANGTKAVRLTKGKKMTFHVTAPKAGYYCIKSIASVDDKAKTIHISVNNGFTSSKIITGTLYAPYKAINAGDIYLANGANTFDIVLADGESIDFDSLLLYDASVELYSGDAATGVPITTTTEGTMTGKVKLNGLFDTKDVFLAIAVYEDNALKHIAVKNQTIAGDATLDVSALNVVKTAGKTYQTKIFVWNNMAGICQAY